MATGNVDVKITVDDKFTDKIGERNFPPHHEDGQVMGTAKIKLECPRCGETIQPGDSVINSGYSRFYRAICAHHYAETPEL